MLLDAWLPVDDIDELVVLPVLPAMEPLADGVVLPEVAALVDAVEGAVDDDVVEGVFDEIVELVESGRQSSCTALFECCFALPVDLFASLPAFGCMRPELPACRLLHGGSSVFAVTVFSVGLVRGLLVAALFIVALLLPLSVAEGCCIDDVELVLFASAGTAIMAATASALTNWERIICDLLGE